MRRVWSNVTATALAGLMLMGKVADAAGFGDYQPEPLYTATITSSFYLPMRDGVALAVELERPAENGQPAAGRFPVIWHHTLSISRAAADGAGFAGQAPGFWQLPSLAKHGYIVAQVARRGSGQSFGIRRGYHDRTEADDAYELTQWFAEQPWSSGAVGIYGCSNTGDAAMHALAARPPALRAVFAGCFSWHKYDVFRRGGIFAQWGTGPARSIEEDLSFPPVAGDENKQLLRQAAEQHQYSTPLLELWQGLPYRDSWSPLTGTRFWFEGSIASYRDQIRQANVALYIQGGWRDELRDQGFIAFLNVPGSRIVMGPWKHCMNDDFPLLAEVHRFFDFHLKGIDNGLAQSPPVHYFHMTGNNTGTWKASESWPEPESRPLQLQLGDGTLDQTRTTKSRRELAVHIPEICAEETIGPFSQPCVERRSDLNYVSDVLTQAVDVTGHPTVAIWLTSSAQDAHLFVYLEDVGPDGTVTVVTEGRLQASLRARHPAPWKMPAGVSWQRAFGEDAKPLLPREPVQLQFDLMPTSWQFQPGHRIRLSIAGADYRERQRKSADQVQRLTILSSGARRSTLTLPVMPGETDVNRR